MRSVCQQDPSLVMKGIWVYDDEWFCGWEQGDALLLHTGKYHWARSNPKQNRSLKTYTTLVTFWMCSLPQNKNWETEEEFLPTSHTTHKLIGIKGNCCWHSLHTLLADICTWILFFTEGFFSDFWNVYLLKFTVFISTVSGLEQIQFHCSSAACDNKTSLILISWIGRWFYMLFSCPGDHWKWSYGSLPIHLGRALVFF